MKKFVLISIAYLSLASTHAYAQVEVEEAYRLFERIESLLAPRVAQKNLVIDLAIKTTKYPGAYARWERHKKEGVITLSPDLLQMKEITSETLSLLICHEYGHFLGGAPTISQRTDSAIMASMMRNPFENLSVEGQADFFATSSCYRELYSDEKTLDQMKDDIDLLIIVFQKLMEMQNIHVSDSQPSRETPSTARASVTLSLAGEYPSLQCRLDTLLVALECEGVDEVSGECLNSEIERPACWFNKDS